MSWLENSPGITTVQHLFSGASNLAEGNGLRARNCLAKRVGKTSGDL